jgi:sensor histidine kinase regulating citrate/malate metabolism
VKVVERDYCIVTIKDDEPGIPDEVKARLFSRSLKRPSGKGIGLYLIIMLAEDLPGKVWVEDRVPGDHTKVARFVVMLPAVEK